MQRPALIIPVEEQVRELDAKLLLACVAAERGFSAVLGSRNEIHLRAASMPRGIYFAKSFRPISKRVFHIMRGLGHDVAAGDEEALVPYPDDLYFVRRVSAESMDCISTLFAWGPSSEALFRRCPGYRGQPIYRVGNPRIDLMRAELQPFHDQTVRDLRQRFGDFILVNTNFGTVNHYVPELGWLTAYTSSSSPEQQSPHLRGLASHRAALFERFKALVPLLARTFPRLNVVVRPHPVESHEVWNRIAAAHENVHSVQEGSVVPWLLASRLLVHNGCTTSVEAFVLGRASIAYLPVTAEEYDNAMPNQLGYRAHDTVELCEQIRRVLLDGLGAPEDPEQHKLLEQHMTALDGSLASDRILDGLEEQLAAQGFPPPPPRFRRASARIHAEARRIVKRAKSILPGNVSSAHYQRHRFPELPLADLEARIARFGSVLGRFDGLRARVLYRDIFEITA